MGHTLSSFPVSPQPKYGTNLRTDLFVRSVFHNAICLQVMAAMVEFTDLGNVSALRRWTDAWFSGWRVELFCGIAKLRGDLIIEELVQALTQDVAPRLYATG